MLTIIGILAGGALATWIGYMVIDCLHLMLTTPKFRRVRRSRR